MVNHFPSFSVENFNVLITGATGYLGREIVSSFVDGGANVYINSRDRVKLEKMQEDFRAIGKKVFIAHFDITKVDEVENFFSQTNMSHLNVLINNAYNGGGGGLNSTKEQFAQSYDVSVASPFILIKNAVPVMKESIRRGEPASVINISSMYGIVSPKFDFYENENGYNPPFYGAAKAGLLQLTRYLGCLLGKEGIRVNAVSPGPFPSESAQLNTKLINGIVGKSPMGRVGKPEELTGAIIFLASKASSYITGSNLVVDGGWTAST